MQNNEQTQQLQRDLQHRMTNLNTLASVATGVGTSYMNNTGAFANGEITAINPKTNEETVSGGGWLSQYGAGDNKPGLSYDLKKAKYNL